ncbi:MAG: hypothetical protein Ct9H90mP22_6110 [Gammaproteobacteria bacterium]|nr:MAG: hypothetical protein Ct9H90mP22_6110 [Gammaproteobacteria bacterium]
MFQEKIKIKIVTKRKKFLDNSPESDEDYFNVPKKFLNEF